MKRRSTSVKETFKPRNVIHFLGLDFLDGQRRFGFTCNYVERTIDGTLGRYFYLFGLSKALENNAFENEENELMIYDIDESKWLRNVRYSGDKPYFSFVFHTGVIFKDTLYYYGGYSGTDSGQSWMNFFSLDVKSHEWKKHPTFGDGRYGHISVILNGKMLIYGGVCIETGGKESKHTIVNFVDEFDFSEREWMRNDKLTKTAPPARVFHSGSLINDRLYIFGGYGTKKKCLEILSDLWMCDTNRVWSEIQINTIPKMFCGSMFHDGGFLYFMEGGRNVTMIDLEDTIPSQVSWNSIFFNDNPDLDQHLFSGSANPLNGQLYFFSGIEIPKFKKDIKSIQELVHTITSFSCGTINPGL
jgi:hypothetical protein